MFLEVYMILCYAVTAGMIVYYYFYWRNKKRDEH